MRRRDVASIAVVAAILAIIVLYIYGNYQRAKTVEVREVNTDQFSFKAPSGFRYITSEERKSFGFPERITVLVKGDFGKLILADMETGLPETVTMRDLRENFRLHKKELEKAVFDFKLLNEKMDMNDSSYTIEYQGKGKEGVFEAVLYSKVVPGGKFNVTVSGPEDSIAGIREELKVIKESLFIR